MLTKQERAEIFMAINNVSKKANEIERKLDMVIQTLNTMADERLNADSSAIDDIADMVAAHNEAIDSLAEMITEREVQ